MSDIDLFEEAYRITISEPAAAGGSRSGLLLGLVMIGNVDLRGVVLGEDGKVTLLDAGLFTIDFRYDAETDRWIDQTGADAAQEEGAG